MISRNHIKKQTPNTFNEGVELSRKIHAEGACLKHVHRADMLIVVRRDYHGNLADAKPCHICQAIIKEKNIKKVFFSTPTGIEELKL